MYCTLKICYIFSASGKTASKVPECLDPGPEQINLIYLTAFHFKFGSVSFGASRIRIRQSEIRLWIRILRSSSKKVNLYFYCFVTSWWLFIFEEWCKCTFKKLYEKNTRKNIFCWRLVGHWWKELDPYRSSEIRIRWSGSIPKCRESGILLKILLCFA